VTDLGEADGELHGAPVDGAELEVEEARDGLVVAHEHVVVVQVPVDELLGQAQILRGRRRLGGAEARRRGEFMWRGGFVWASCVMRPCEGAAHLYAGVLETERSRIVCDG
jgi:hypothetical protein